jgi:hypothetical protein
MTLVLPVPNTLHPCVPKPQAVVFVVCDWQNPAGTLPPALGFCKDLLYLDLSGHSLSGELPALPPSIQFLNVSSNGLSGSLPEFAVDAQLQYLDLSFNRCGQVEEDCRHRVICVGVLAGVRQTYAGSCCAPCSGYVKAFQA